MIHSWQNRWRHCRIMNTWISASSMHARQGTSCMHGFIFCRNKNCLQCSRKWRLWIHNKLLLACYAGNWPLPIPPRNILYIAHYYTAQHAHGYNNDYNNCDLYISGLTSFVVCVLRIRSRQMGHISSLCSDLGETAMAELSETISWGLRWSSYKLNSGKETKRDS